MFALRVRLRRPDTPRVESDSAADLNAEELGRGLLEGSDFFAELRVVREHAHDAVVGQVDECHDRRGREIRVGVDRPLCVGGNIIRVPAGLTSGRKALGRAAVEARPVEVALRGVGRRGGVVEPAAGGVHGLGVDDIEVALGDARETSAIGARDIGVTPAVALAQPEKIFAPVQPLHGILALDPRRIGLGVDRARRAGLRIGEHHAEGVLQTVQLLGQELRSGGRPLQVRQVVLARIAGNIEPAHGAARRGDYTQACGGIFFADLGIGERGDLRIEGRGVVDEVKFADTAGIELPESDGPAVGAPAIRVAEAEFLLVDPVGGAVDERG